MKKLLLTVLSIVLLSSTLIAQPYLNRLVDLGRAEGANDVDVIGEHYYMTGIIADPWKHDLFVLKTNRQGDTVYNRVYGDRDSTEKWWGTELEILGDSTMLVFGSITGGGQTRNLLLRVKADGDTLWAKTWQKDTLSDVFRMAVRVNDTQFALIGTRYRTNPTSRAGLFYTLVDSSGAVLVDTMLTGFQYYDHISGACLSHNKNSILITGWRNKFAPFPDYDYNLLVLECALDGGLVRIKEFPSPYRSFDPYITPLKRSNSNYIVAASEEIDPHPFKPGIKGRVLEIDSNFNIRFDTLVGYHSVREVTFSRHMVATNGDLVLLGAVETDPSEIDLAWMVRLDSNYQVQWSRTYTTDSAWHHYLYDLVEEPDGGLLAVGNGYGQSQDVWLLRVDSAGCLVADCDSVDDTTGINYTVLPEGFIEVYPNPANLHLTLQWQGGTPAGTVSLYDLQGREVLQQAVLEASTQMDVSRLAAALYLAIIRDEKGRVVWRKKVVVE